MADEFEDEELDYGSPYTGMPGLAVLGMGNQFTTPEARKYAQEYLTRMDSGAMADEQDAYMQRVQQQSEAARSALRAARAKIEARKNSKTSAWLALAAGLGSPTRTGAIGEQAGIAAQNLIEPLEKRRQFDIDKDKNLLDLDMALSQVDSSELAARLQLLKMKQEQAGRMGVKALDILGRPLQMPQSKAQNAAIQAGDRAMATTYNEWAVEGGAANATKSLNDLARAGELLAGPKDPKTGKRIPPKNLTGPLIGTVGQIPWIGEWLQNLALPEAADVRQTVEYTVQQSLRPILGAQFTRDEGERLIARVYNPMLQEEVNAARVQALHLALKRVAEQKNAASKYWEKHRTMGPTIDSPTGFRARINWDDATVEDLLPMGSLPGDDILAKKARERNMPSFKDEPQNDPWEGAEEINYEDLVPAGSPLDELDDQDYAEGGEVDGERKKVTMSDGRVIWAPSNVPDEVVTARYNKAMGIEEAPAPTPVADTEEVPMDEETTEFEIQGPDAIELAGSAVGHGILGAAGGRYGTKLLQSLPDLIPSHRISPAQGRVLQALENEGLTPAEWAKLVTQARRLGVPVTGLDMGGIEMRALGEQSMNPNNKSTRDLYTDLTKRQASAPARVEEHINKALKPDPYMSTMKKLRGELKERGKEKYGDLYAKYPTVQSKQLFQLMNTPSGAKAVKQATKSILDRPGATIGKQDAMGMVTKPSLEFLDQVKDELDDMILAEEGEGVNYQATKKGKRLRELRKAFRDELDLATTDPKTKVSAYKEARSQYAGDLEIIDALRYGREDFAKATPDEVADYVKGLNFSERDALRSGVAQHLMDQLGKTSGKSNPAQKLINTPAQMEKLEALFDQPNEFKVLKAALETEAKMYEESAPTIRKGRSALTSMKDAKDNVIRRTAKQAPFNVFSATAWAVKLLRWKEGIKPKEADEIIKILRTGDPAEMRKLEKSLTSKVGRPARRKLRTKVGTITGAAAAAGIPLMREYERQQELEEDDTEEPQQYAKGGLVRKRKPAWALTAELALSETMYDGGDITSLIR